MFVCVKYGVHEPPNISGARLCLQLTPLPRSLWISLVLLKMGRFVLMFALTLNKKWNESVFRFTLKGLPDEEKLRKRKTQRFVLKCVTPEPAWLQQTVTCAITRSLMLDTEVLKQSLFSGQLSAVLWQFQGVRKKKKKSVPLPCQKHYMFLSR